MGVLHCKCPSGEARSTFLDERRQHTAQHNRPTERARYIINYLINSLIPIPAKWEPLVPPGVGVVGSRSRMGRSLLESSGDFWRVLEYFGVFWNFLKFFGVFLESFGVFWSHQQLFEVVRSQPELESVEVNWSRLVQSEPSGNQVFILLCFFSVFCASSSYTFVTKLVSGRLSTTS